jgi:hypothetical protein
VIVEEFVKFDGELDIARGDDVLDGEVLELDTFEPDLLDDQRKFLRGFLRGFFALRAGNHHFTFVSNTQTAASAPNQNGTQALWSWDLAFS